MLKKCNSNNRVLNKKIKHNEKNIFINFMVCYTFGM